MVESTLTLDFRQVPILEAARALRSLALALVEAIFARHTVPEAVTFARRIDAFVQPSPPEWLLRHGATLGPAAAPKKRGAQAVAPTPLAWSEIIAQVAREVLSLEQGRVRFLEAIEAHWEGLGPQHVPQAFWRSAGIVAWLDAAFQMKVALLLRKSVTRSLLLPAAALGELFPPEGKTTAWIAPQTFWLLLALAETGAGRAYVLPEAERSPASTLLTRIIDDQARGDDWSHIFDQLLIAQALRRDPGVLGLLPDPVQAQIRALPLFQAAPGFLPPTTQPAAKPSSKGKGKAVPAWAVEYIKAESAVL